MKTKSNTQETVNNQVRKMVLRGSAIIFSLALICLSVNAQELWDKFLTSNTCGKMAFLMDGQCDDTKSANAAFEAIDAELSIKLNHSSANFTGKTEQEKEMQVEAWMTDGTYFTSTTEFNKIEREESLRVEEWMINNENFSKQSVAESVELEKPMEIESWMTVEAYFVSANIFSASDTEPALRIERWMLDNKNFSNNLIIDKTNENEPMKLEAWMLDNQNWAF